MSRLVHYAADALMVSTILGGIKQSAGLTFDTERITEPNTRMVVQKFLGAGDYLFDAAASFAQGSSYFRAAGATSAQDFFGIDPKLRSYQGSSGSPAW
ncbi:hypothetical protein MSPP1_003947 [Malassezia sp. CBS 17886]|nr:hypothetical protein MSPP1_003947 [Malassezia sp. CBS 17886]